MKKNFIVAMTAVALAVPAFAQETYESAMIATEDLNGTARYVGMGGALEALGADISVMGSNPAGIGLFRKTNASVSFGAISVPEQKLNFLSTAIDGKTVASFDQVGIVFATPFGSDYVNFGFNYHKSRNFNEILSAANALRGASQNKNSYIKGLRGSTTAGGFNIDYNTKNELIGYDNEKSEYTSRNYSQTDYLLWNSFIEDPISGDFYYRDADHFIFNREQEGYIGEFDFNISGNHDDRIFWGVTLGIKDVNYSHHSEYIENLLNASNGKGGYIRMLDNRDITGTGYDIAAGVILRPIDESPFRVGFSIKTPTWYELRSTNYSYIENETGLGYSPDGKSNEEYKYKMFTPWKFGVSLGHTIGNDFALGLSYDYADYGSINNRYITNETYDWEGYGYSSSDPDRIMNAHTKRSLKGVSTLKLGAEMKITPELAVRAGYNHVTPMYKSDAMRNLTIGDDGCYYSSTTDYTNWKATNRVTCGVGYATNKFSIDFAYQYSAQSGDFYPFESLSTKGLDADLGNTAPIATEVKNNRHQFIMTLGVRL